MVLSRFPKLNANKVYATGFSLGGGMTQYLLCYRSSLFRGFSIVSATLLNGDQQRGDHDGDLTIQTTDPNSLVATCGKTQWDAGHATGIIKPDLWGYGITNKKSLNILFPYGRSTKPVVLFAGDHDSFLSVQDIEDTTAEIISRNNLDPVGSVNPVNYFKFDNAFTEYKEFKLAEQRLQPSSAFVRYKVTRTVNDTTDDPLGFPVLSADHAMPDADEFLTLFAPFMTRDYNYTDETINFFETHADLNLNP